MLPTNEKNRVIDNLGLIIAAPEGANGTVTVLTPGLPAPLTVPVANGIALSNAPPLTDPANPASPAPLNALVGLDAATKITIGIAASALTNVDLSKLSEVALLVAYHADA